MKGIFAVLLISSVSSADLSEHTPLGLGACSFASEKICEISLVDGEASRAVTRLNQIQFKKFQICQHTDQRTQFSINQLDRLNEHVEGLLRLKDTLKSERTFFQISGRAENALEELLKISKKITDSARSGRSSDHSHDRKNILVLQELAMAAKSNFLYPVDEDQSIPQALGSFLENHAQVIGVRPKQKSCNLENRPSHELIYSDGRRAHLFSPEASSFWSSPQNITRQNLRIGYGRSRVIDYQALNLKYDSPKDGYGINPGFNTLGRDGAEYKIRLGPEVKTGSFNSRIVNALGYPVVQIDYVKNLRTQFDLKLFQEFNSRKSLGFNLNLLGQRLTRIELQQVYDPFEYIDSAELTNGQRISGAELKNRLVRPGSLPADFANENSFDLAAARNVKSLYWKEVSVEKKNENWKALGSWFYSGLRHEDRRELRGFAVLAAWLGIYDIRWENTRLFEVKENIRGNNQKKLLHVISDLGSGLGNSGGILSNSVGEVADISYKFFHLIYGYVDHTGAIQPWAGDRDIYPTPVPQFFPIFPRYSSILPNGAFHRTDLEDTIWMAELISQLTPQQIADSARVSGFSENEISILVERLFSRRNNLIQELYLKGSSIRDLNTNLIRSL